MSNSTLVGAVFLPIAALAAALGLAEPLPLDQVRTSPDHHRLDDDGYRMVDGPRRWTFPRDFGRHDGFRIEWWYLTGNLTAVEPDPATGEPREFGFQLTFFRSELAPNVGAPADPGGDASTWRGRDLYFGHFAISDIADERFIHAERVSRAHPRLARASAETMDVRLLDWSLRLDESGDVPALLLAARDGGHAIDLRCAVTRGLTFQGDAEIPAGNGPYPDGAVGGLNSKGGDLGQASYYYSFTRLATTGTVTIDGAEHRVSGLAWMDHEFSSNQLADDQEGWDWFSLQLADGRDVMAYRLRTPGGRTDYAFASVVQPDGSSARYGTDEVRLAGDELWTSPETGGAYPQRWRVEIGPAGDPVFAGVVRSRFDGQELRTEDSTDISYLEAAVEVLDPSGGRRLGRGYMELVGYDESVGASF